MFKIIFFFQIKLKFLKFNMSYYFSFFLNKILYFSVYFKTDHLFYSKEDDIQIKINI